MAQAGGKIVVVAGCSRGMSREMVRGFAASGCTVVGVARSATAIAELQSEYHAPHRFDALDVATGDISGWAKSVVSSHGAPNLAINNAGLINKPANTWEIPEEEFSKLIDVNVKGTFAVCRALIPSMISAGRGVVVNFSSIWGRGNPPAAFSPYAACKYAVEGLTGALAKELPPGLAAVTVHPGIINTDMLHVVMGSDANGARSEEDWTASAIHFFLGIGVKDNGKKLTIPYC